MAPLISVLMPVHNAEKFVAAAVRSVLAQSCSNLELLVVDDGSTDSSPDILRSVADERINVHRFEVCRGISAALNFGIKAASGKYIARMDADDLCHSDRFRAQLDFITKTGADVCGTAVKLFGAKRGLKFFPESNDDIRLHLLFGCPIAHPTVFGLAEVFKLHMYSEDAQFAEDLDLWIRMARANVRFANMRDAHLSYRVHRTQVSTQRRRAAQEHTQVLTARFAAEQADIADLLTPIRQVNYGNVDAVTTDAFLCAVRALRNIIRRRGGNDELLQAFSLNLAKRIRPMNLQSMQHILRVLGEDGIRFSAVSQALLRAQSLLQAGADSRVFKLARQLRRLA